MRTFPEGNFAARLVDRLGANSALIDAANGETISGGAIAAKIAGFGAGFLSLGLRPRDRVLISCGLNSASALAYLGAMYVGCVPVLVDERTIETSGELLFAKAQIKAAWTNKGVRWDWAKKNGFPQIEDSFDRSSVDPVAPARCGEDDVAALMPTSGSTGVPRLVMVTHDNLIANTEAIIRSQHLGPDERAMLIMPLSYCFGASVLHTHLYQGGGVVFDSRFMFPDKVLHAISTFDCTTFAGVPTIYNILLRRSHLRSIPLPRLRRFLQAGGALAPECVSELRSMVPQADFLVMYGQTEATARISCSPPGRSDTKPGSVGVALDNLTLRIVDAKGEQVSAGETGEIQVFGASVCAGYLDDPEATSSKFENGWLKTGDLGCIDEEGCIWVKGRISGFVKIRGYRVSLAEVEARVAAIAGVCECAATGVKHPEAGEALALFIVAEGVTDGGDNSLEERVRRALPSQWTCSSVSMVSELPRTANGKIARSLLPTFA
ncbi:MAG: class I adenylate-forming enzyme family protein [Candidatus Sulfotelmatobacter sp.]